jgi:hypothetical protein
MLLTVALLSITVSLTAFRERWYSPVAIAFVPNDFNVTVSFDEAIFVEVVSKQSVRITVRILY